jgi:SAM-dependent methyltransferase
MTGNPAGPGSRVTPKIDTTIPHSARIWNYWLGGKDNYAVDRAAGDEYARTFPQITEIARQGRYFLARAVRFLAGEHGVRQFLDIGTGLPAVDNTHEVAQRTAPDCKIVYVDNDPLVLAHARALLTSTPEGACHYVDADLRDPAAILSAAGRVLDLAQPVAVVLIGVLGHIGDDAEAAAVVGHLARSLPPGGFLAIADSIDRGRSHTQAAHSYAATGAVPYQLRPRDQIASFFTGLELVEPGLVPITQWRPDPSPFAAPELPIIGAVARKP